MPASFICLHILSNAFGNLGLRLRSGCCRTKGAYLLAFQHDVCRFLGTLVRLIKNRKDPEANIISAHRLLTHTNYMDPVLREQFISRLQRSDTGQKLAAVFGTGKADRKEFSGREIRDLHRKPDWELLCGFFLEHIIGLRLDDIPHSASTLSLPSSCVCVLWLVLAIFVS